MFGHDFSGFNFLVGIIALISAIRPSFLPSVFPRLKNWWSQRSKSSLQTRIMKLEKKLSNCVAPSEMLSMTEDRILYGITFVGMMLVFIVQLIPSLAVLGLSVFTISELHPTKASLSSELCIIFLWIFSYVLSLMVNQKYIEELAKYRSLRSPVERNNLEASIQKLQEKLDSKNRASSSKRNEIVS